jgi:hypothetical protein
VGVAAEGVGAVWFRGYPSGDEGTPNHLVRDSHISCLVEYDG